MMLASAGLMVGVEGLGFRFMRRLLIEVHSSPLGQRVSEITLIIVVRWLQLPGLDETLCNTQTKPFV